MNHSKTKVPFKKEGSSEDQRGKAAGKDEPQHPVIRSFTDLGNAERFIDQHGNKMRYCPGLKKWFVCQVGDLI